MGEQCAGEIICRMTVLPLLAHISAIPKNTAYLNRPKMLIMHGLFGTKQNWRSTIDHLSASLEVQVDAIDLRNHGYSSHTSETSIPAMAQDVIIWCQQQPKDSQFILVGHSMGGKIVLELLSKPEITLSIPAAILLDISPLSPTRNPELQKTIDRVKLYSKAMLSIQEMRLNDRQKISEILGNTVAIEFQKQYLLANLQWNDQNSRDYLKFRFNISCLDKSLDDLMYWIPPKIRNDIPILFLSGSKSPYLPSRDFQLIQKLIPNAEFRSISSAHELHIEKPEETQTIICSFIRKHLKTVFL